jgi:hypothetical protein
MTGISKPQLNIIVHAFGHILDKKCWALSNGKVPWDYDRGFGLAWSDCDLLMPFWEATDQLYDRKTHGAGLGLFLGENNRIACLDLDGTLANEKTPSSETAQRIVNGSCTFTETSVSGRGLHLFYEVDTGTLPFHLRSGISGKDGDFFTQKRFIRLTGQVYGKEYPIRYLPPHHVEYFREYFGKAPVSLPLIKPFTGQISDRSLASRLSGACIPFRSATISPQPFHNEHGGISECIETLCPNVNEHTTDASPNARFVRCADGLITGRCFHQHCEPEVLRASGNSLAGMLSAKIRAAGDPTIVFTLLEKCEKMGMRPINGTEVSRMGYPAVVETCESFLKARGGAKC